MLHFDSNDLNKYQVKARELKGELHYEIRINQLALVVFGFIDKLDPRDCIVLHCIHQIAQYQSNNNKKQYITYDHLLKCLPLLKKFGCGSKATLSRIVNKLYKLDLIIIDPDKGKKNTYQVTELGLQILYFRIDDELQPVSSMQKRSVPTKKEQTISPKEKHSVSDKKKNPVSDTEKHNSIKNSNNLYIEKNNPSDSEIESKIKKYKNEALEYFDSLSPNDSRLFDSRAYNLLDFSCPIPKPNSVEMKKLRIEYYIYQRGL